MSRVRYVLTLATWLVLLCVGRCNARARRGGAEEVAGDVCMFERDEVTPLGPLVECLRAVPNEIEIQRGTATSLAKAAQLYAFLDIATESPDEHQPVAVDLLEELHEIGWNRTFQWDWSLHETLMILYKRLYDAHAEYYPPKCYRSLSVRQPLAPISYVVGDEQIVAVSPDFDADLVAYLQQTMNLDVTEFSGATILAVDGVAAMEYFELFADSSVGVSKDPGTRLNLVFSSPQPRPDVRIVRPSHWQNRNLKYAPLPQTSNVTYDLLLPNDTKVAITLPWLASSEVQYAGLKSFRKDCGPASMSKWHKNQAAASSINDESARVLANDPLGMKRRSSRSCTPQELKSIGRAHCPRLYVQGSGTSGKGKPRRDVLSGQPTRDQGITILANSTDLTMWMLPDWTTAVLYIDTMGSRFPLETFQALVKGFDKAAQNNLTKLVIDLTNNPGGRICFGRALLAYIQEGGRNWGPQDLPLSELQHMLTTLAVEQGNDRTIWSPGYYRDQHDTRIANNDTSMFDPGFPHKRGAGRVRRYSALVHYSGVWIHECGNIGYWLPPPKKFSPQDIIIVTHGYCGSTCAYFANHMALYDNVRTMVVGGRAGVVQQYSSYPGIQVLDSELIYWGMFSLGVNITSDIVPDDPVPRLLPTSASFRYCIREIYPPSPALYSAQPTEFVFQQATFHVNNTKRSAVFPTDVWFEAAEILRH